MKSAHVLLLLVAVTLSIAFLPSPADALTVGVGQDSMVIVIERGQTFNFILNLRDINTAGTLRFTGAIAGWSVFSSNMSPEYQIYPATFNEIPVTISIPKDQELGEYDGEIVLDGVATLSKIKVKVTLELSDAKAYQKLSEVDKKVGTLNEQVGSLTDMIGSLRRQIISMEEEVSDKMEEVRLYQKNLTMLENENKALKADKARLEESNKILQQNAQNLETSNRQLDELTGMMATTEIPGMFMLGMIIGILCVALVVKRNSLAMKIKMWQHHSQRRKERRLNYSFKP